MFRSHVLKLKWMQMLWHHPWHYGWCAGLLAHKHQCQTRSGWNVCENDAISKRILTLAHQTPISSRSRPLTIQTRWEHLLICRILYCQPRTSTGSLRSVYGFKNSLLIMGQYLYLRSPLRGGGVWMFQGVRFFWDSMRANCLAEHLELGLKLNHKKNLDEKFCLEAKLEVSNIGPPSKTMIFLGFHWDSLCNLHRESAGKSGSRHWSPLTSCPDKNFHRDFFVV